MDWKTIDTAPMDGTRIYLKNENNGLLDIGSYTSWHDMPDWQREMLPEFAKEWNGEWEQDEGNGEMTHWAEMENKV